MENKIMDARYAEVYRYRGYPICTLKLATPSEGDKLGYVIDDTQFYGVTCRSIGEAIAMIDSRNR